MINAKYKNSKGISILVYYNQTKGGTDTFDAMCSTMSCSNKSNRWPITMVYGIHIILSSYIATTFLRKMQSLLIEGIYEKINHPVI